MTEGVVRCDDGAACVEIPPFGPGAGSAASAGMTEVWAGMAEGEGQE